ncbi:MAG: preQ(1) synthase [bacterium]|nr:preQ(1) synthase [bacterium]
MSTKPTKRIKVIPNPYPQRNYVIEITSPEFTCLCPITGQPDFATFKIEYIPDKKIIELKGLKLYLWSYRNEGHFHEGVTNKILDDLVRAAHPRWMRIIGTFNVRGGIYTTVTAEHGIKPEKKQ